MEFSHSFRVELLDYLESIDCSLEDFQAMLSGRQFSIDPDLLVDVNISTFSSGLYLLMPLWKNKYFCILGFFKEICLINTECKP